MKPMSMESRMMPVIPESTVATLSQGEESMSWAHIARVGHLQEGEVDLAEEAAAAFGIESEDGFNACSKEGKKGIGGEEKGR